MGASQSTHLSLFSCTSSRSLSWSVITSRGKESLVAKQEGTAISCVFASNVVGGKQSHGAEIVD
jgi:hypothetical protein